MRLKNVADIRRNTVDIIIILVALVKKGIRQRIQPSVSHELHDHVFGGAHQIIYISKGEHIVQVFICAESGILDSYPLPICFKVPVREIVKDRVLADDIPALQVYDLIFSPSAFVNVFLPVAYTEDHLFFVSGGSHDWMRAGQHDTEYKEITHNFPHDSFHRFSPFLLCLSSLEDLRFMSRTTIRTMAKITVDKAQRAVLISV